MATAVTAVVLAGGRGRRLQTSDHAALRHASQRRAAAAGLKALMPVDASGTRPLVDYALSALADAGCTKAVLVVPPAHDDLRRHLARRTSPRVEVRLAVQPVADGTAGAVAAAADAVDDSQFLVVNGDNLYPVDAMRALMAIDGCGLAAFSRETLTRAGGFSSERVAAFATVQCDPQGWLTGITEKPPVEQIERSGPAALVSMNLWRGSRALFEACRDVPRSPRGERELPDAVMLTVSRGTPFRVLEATGAVLDLTSAEDLPAVSRALAGAEPRP